MEFSQEIINKWNDDYKKFKSSLPDNLKNTDEKEYDLRYYWENQGKPRDFREALQKKMFTKQEDGVYHAPSVEPNTLRFLKAKNHPTIGKELDWYNSKEPSAIDFRNKYNLDQSGDFLRYVPRPTF